MLKNSLCILFVLGNLINPAFGQNVFEYFISDFLDPANGVGGSDHIEIEVDSVWQVGTSVKAIGATNYGVLITDTVNGYPPNWTGSNLLTIPWFYGGDQAVGQGLQLLDSIDLYASWRLDSDSLQDMGHIELSMDSGQHWLDLSTPHPLVQSSFYVNQSLGNILLSGTGNVDAFWRIDAKTYIEDSLGNTYAPERLLFRTTFLSDSIDNSREGWAYHYFEAHLFYATPESIHEEQFSLEARIFPNPTFGEVQVQLDGGSHQGATLQVINSLGQVVEQTTITNAVHSLDLSENAPGLYHLVYIGANGKTRDTARIILAH